MSIIGIDEVGRGCWAGPLVAGAVLLADPIEGLADSKKLSRHMRERLDMLIWKCAAAAGIGWVEPAEVDTLGLTAAVRLAMQRAVAAIDMPYAEIIIDGSYNFLAENRRSRAVVRADGSVPAVSAASIIAKVARDAYMRTTAASDYPQYGFEAHVGYGTAIHQAALQQYGVTPIHRQSYKPVQRLLS